MKKLVIILVCSVTGLLQAQFTSNQRRVLDSLNKIIDNPSAADTSRAAAYVGLSDILYIISADTLIPLCEKAILIAEKRLLIPTLSLAEKHQFKYIMATAYNNLGVGYNNRRDAIKSLEFYIKGVKLYSEIGDQRGIAQSNANMGDIYDNLGQVEKALDCYVKSLEVSEKIKDKPGISLALNNLGYLYNTQKEYKKSLDYLLISLKISQELNEINKLPYTLGNIGAAYFRMDDNVNALKYFDECLKMQKQNANRDGVAAVLNNMAAVFVSLKDFDKAVVYFKEAFDINTELKNKLGQEAVYIGLANMYAIKKELGPALENGQKALSISTELNYPGKISAAANVLQTIYLEMKDYKNAYKMQALYYSVKDSIQNGNFKKATIRQNMVFEFEKKQAIREAEFVKETEKREVIIKDEHARKNLIIVFIVAGFLIVIVFSGFLYNRFRIISKQKIIIEEQKELVEEKQKEVLDSIHYAKRIQTALITNEKYIDKNLNRLQNDKT